jgi:hypothetical protein
MADLSRFLVLFQIPPAVIAEWMKTDPATRGPAEQEMREKWQAWMQRNGQMFVTSEAGGATKRVTPDGVADYNNGVMLYSVVQGASHDEVARAFADHPHLTIPQASIEVMAVRPMTGM